MELWQQWWILAQESQQGAMAAEDKDYVRSAVSRYYYAAFQAATAVLHYAKLTPPDDEEGWSHQSTPEMLEEHLKPLLSSRDNRQRLKRQLQELYKLRIKADYQASRIIDSADVSTAKRMTGYIISSIDALLPKGS